MTARLALLETFVENDCIPAEPVFAGEMDEIEARTGSRWTEIPPVLTGLKSKARSLGLWNLFMPKGHPGSANVPMAEYAKMSELMGRSFIAPEACNCSAPDTGNMEVFANYGTAAQQARWLAPLLQGTIRSAFLMTEPAVASSDATNIACSVRREDGMYVINGRKWWSSGAMDPRCKVAIVMCRHEGSEWEAKGSHGRHSMVVVPMDTPGVRPIRALKVFGYDDAPHGHAEVDLKDVRVPLSSIILGEGRGFEIAQGRLGPGRVHHCMRAVGMAERALAAFVKRSRERVAFGKPLSEDSVVRYNVAECRMEIAQVRNEVDPPILPVLLTEMGNTDECDTEKFGTSTINSRGKTFATHGASRLVHAMSAWSVKPDVLRSGIVVCLVGETRRASSWHYRDAEIYESEEPGYA